MLGASAIARSDATIAIYMMIHMALPPTETHALVGSPRGTVRAQTGGIAAWMIPQAKIVKPCLCGNACDGRPQGRR